MALYKPGHQPANDQTTAAWPLQPDPAVDLTEAETVTIGGTPCKVPVLPMRQVKKIVPLIAQVSAIDPAGITEEQMEIGTRIVWLALTRAYPLMSFDAVEERLQFAELIAALPVIIAQTKAFAAKDPAMKGAAPGEAPAAISPTGTGSSPTS